MRPLTLDDLVALDEFADRRRDYFESLSRYVDRYRRIRLGPVLTLLFENRQTLWFRIQEVIRIARVSEPGLVQQELDLHNRLLPERNQLHASLLIDVPAAKRLSEELNFWRDLSNDAIRLDISGQKYGAQLITCRPEDRCVGAAHWVLFQLDAEGRRRFADLRYPAHFEINHADYRHFSQNLNDELRQSLLDDLELSDRD